MEQQDEDDIIGEFTRALKGRYAPLKPAKAVENRLDYIKELRADSLSWSTIENLFNKALVRHKLPGLATGSLSRLFLIALRRSRTDGSKTTAAPALGEPEDKRVPNSHLPIGTAGPGGTAQASTPIPLPTRPGTATDPEADRHLARIQQRRADKSRMDKA